MAEYIEREALIKATASLPFGCRVVARNIIEKQPAADVVPLVRGKWVQDVVFVDENTGEPCTAWFCDRCSEPQQVGTNYCPYCGATMEDG